MNCDMEAVKLQFNISICLAGMPVNPAIVAAALNQAGWGLVGNIQGGQQGNDHQSFNHPSGFGHGNAPTPQGAGGQQPPESGFMGWAGTDGPAPQGPPNAGPPTQPPAGWSRDKQPFMKYNM